MHRVLSVGSLEVTDKAHQLKGVSLDALVASLIRFVAFLLSASTQEALMDATMQLYHGVRDRCAVVPSRCRAVAVAVTCRMSEVLPVLTRLSP